MMTPMLRELHEARKDRLQRMKAWHGNNTIVPLHKVRPVVSEEPDPEPIIEPVEIVCDREVKPLADVKVLPISDGESLKIAQIQQVVAQRYRIDMVDIKSDSRNAFVMLPRQIAYTLARRLTGKSLPSIARSFNRDHTTIMYGARKVEERAERDAEFAAELEQLEKIITGDNETICPCCGRMIDRPTRGD